MLPFKAFVIFCGVVGSFGEIGAFTRSYGIQNQSLRRIGVVHALSYILGPTLLHIGKSSAISGCEVRRLIGCEWYLLVVVVAPKIHLVQIQQNAYWNDVVNDKLERQCY